MKIYFSKYQIHFKNRPNSQVTPGSREGALLKLALTPHIVGYADVFTFPEFGELDLEMQLKSLAAGKPSLVMHRALAFAHLDARARSRQRSLFSGLVLPQSHKRVRNLEEAEVALRDGFSRLKVKMGRDLASETKWLEALATKLGPSQLRLDFNGAVNAQDFESWWNQLRPPTRACIDFIEDAFIPDQVSRAEFLKLEGLAPLAWDWFKPAFPVKRVIVKPLRETYENVGPQQRVIFTHSMGHRLGQATSLWSAARFYKKYPAQMEIGGLRPTEPSPEWRAEGPRVLAPSGTGFGFDQELANQRWEPFS